MYDFIQLNVNCPNCKKSLMDNEKHVDGTPGIRLNIKCAGSSGTIHLSSIYESYNYTTDIDTPKNELIKLFCPHCSDEITSDDECQRCSAPMIPLALDFGGIVSICSRVGCKNHFLEFDDVSLALSELYIKGKIKKVRVPEEIKKTEDHKEILETGSFLHSYCPHCHKTLIENNIIKLSVKNENGEKGYIFLSPYLNVFTSKSTVFLPEGEAIKDISCFNCDTSLLVNEQKCNECGGNIAKFELVARTKLINFHICSTKGCKWHGLSDEDRHNIELEDSLEW